MENRSNAVIFQCEVVFALTFMIINYFEKPRHFSTDSCVWFILSNILGISQSYVLYILNVEWSIGYIGTLVL